MNKQYISYLFSFILLSSPLYAALQERPTALELAQHTTNDDCTQAIAECECMQHYLQGGNEEIEDVKQIFSRNGLLYKPTEEYSEQEKTALEKSIASMQQTLERIIQARSRYGESFLNESISFPEFCNVIKKTHEGTFSALDLVYYIHCRLGNAEKAPSCENRRQNHHDAINLTEAHAQTLKERLWRMLGATNKKRRGAYWFLATLSTAHIGFFISSKICPQWLKCKIPTWSTRGRYDWHSLLEGQLLIAAVVLYFFFFGRGFGRHIRIFDVSHELEKLLPYFANMKE